MLCAVGSPCTPTQATGRVVAIKKVRFNSSSEGVHITALREIKALKEVGAGGRRGW